MPTHGRCEEIRMAFEELQAEIALLFDHDDRTSPRTLHELAEPRSANCSTSIAAPAGMPLPEDLVALEAAARGRLRDRRRTRPTPTPCARRPEAEAEDDPLLESPGASRPE